MRPSDGKASAVMSGLLDALMPWRRHVQPRQRYLSVLGPRGFYRLAYAEWGDRNNPRVLVCVHGLTRLGRDFDELAQALSSHYRVVCPDMPGRGESDWFQHKMDYGPANYVAACAALIARLGVEKVDWLGTSMGGIIGMTMASLPNAPIKRMIVNDVGPFIPKAALERIASYTGADPRFADLAEAELTLRRLAAPFGIQRDEHWRRFTAISTRPDGSGKLKLHYDPGIAMPFKEGPIADAAFWPVWDAIKCPVLVLRGAESDLLLAQTAKEMTERGPKAKVIEVPGCGHAPALMEESQIALVRDWLAQASN
jgi:pimeloyl-ACP methyl ester carboxylesterase